MQALGFCRVARRVSPILSPASSIQANLNRPYSQGKQSSPNTLPSKLGLGAALALAVHQYKTTQETECDYLHKSYFAQLMDRIVTDYQERPDIPNIKATILKDTAFITEDIHSKQLALQPKLVALDETIQTNPTKPLTFSIVGAGLAGLSLAVKLHSVFPDSKITIIEKRAENSRFQTISFRLNDISRAVFEGTPLLENPNGDSLFEEAGAWFEPLPTDSKLQGKAPVDQDNRLRAPILVYQNAMANYLRPFQNIEFLTQSADLSAPNDDPNHIRFICTGQTPNLTQEAAPFQLDTHPSQIVHAWKFQALDTPVKPLPYAWEDVHESTVMTGGNQTKRLTHFFEGLSTMAQKKGTQVHLAKGKTLSDLKSDMKEWQSKNYVKIQVFSRYIKGEADVFQKGLDQYDWSSFWMIPYIGMDPFFYSSPLGNIMAVGDSVNARHPYHGNGSKAIFQGVQNSINYLSRYQKLDPDSPDFNSHVELLEGHYQLTHQEQNIPRMVESMLDYLNFLDAVSENDS